MENDAAQANYDLEYETALQKARARYHELAGITIADGLARFFFFAGARTSSDRFMAMIAAHTPEAVNPEPDATAGPTE